MTSMLTKGVVLKQWSTSFCPTLGLYPCERDGIASLKQTSGCSYWLKCIVMYMLVLVSVWISFLYLVIEETSLEEIMTEIDRRILPKITDKIAIGGNMITLTSLSFMTITKLRSLATQLICIQEFIDGNARLRVNAIRKPMMVCYINLIPLVIIM